MTAPASEKMDSREFGLVLAQHLLDLQDLHYGLWDDDLPLSIANMSEAQQRYTDFLIGALPKPDPTRTPLRVLDIGCGAGHVMKQLLERGYTADGVVPAPALARMVRERLDDVPGHDSRVFECKFEDLPASDSPTGRYQVCLFSESFQYLKMRDAFAQCARLLEPGGLVVICDVFKSEHHGDGGKGDKSMRGGKRIDTFHELVEDSPFEVVRDEDITKRVSGNLELLNDILMNRARPAILTLDRFLGDRYPRTAWLVRRLARKHIEKANFKYFTGLRSRETFERYKTYRLIVLERR